MDAPAQLLPASFSLAAVLCWGTSDFVGGYGVRGANAFVFTALAHASGLTMMSVLAAANHSVFPPYASACWAVIAGAVGGISLAIFYRALSLGQMGLSAPLAALMGAGIPTIFVMMTEGAPGRGPMVGFLLAGLGIWLISRPDGSQSQAAGLGLAALSGVGFAGFYICIKQAGDSSALWTAALSRGASLIVTMVAAAVSRPSWQLSRHTLLLALVAGWLDVSGSALFIRASQTGRLDAAVVISSLYPAITVLLARILLKERFTRWKTVGMVAALLAVPMIALQ